MAFSRAFRPDYVKLLLHFKGKFVIDEDVPVSMTFDELRPLFRNFGCGPLDDLVVETITIDLKRREATEKHLKIVRSGHFYQGVKAWKTKKAMKAMNAKMEAMQTKVKALQVKMKAMQVKMKAMQTNKKAKKAKKWLLFKVI